MKRTFIILLLLAQLGCGALAEPYIVQYPDGVHSHNTHALLLSADGQALCDPGAYAEIRRLTPLGLGEDRCLYAATRSEYPLGTEYGSDLLYNSVLLMDSAGRPVTDYAFSDLRYDADTDRLIFRRHEDGKLRSGVMTRDGRVLGHWPLETLVPNGEGGYIGLSENNRLAWIDVELAYHDTGRTAWGLDTEGFCDGRMVLYSEGPDIYIDPRGQRAFDADYAGLCPFHGGWAAVKPEGVDGPLAFVDASGSLLPMRYDSILWSSQDCGYVCADSTGVDFYHADDGMRVARIPVDTENSWRVDYIHSYDGDIAVDATITEMPRWKGVVAIAVENEGLYCYDTEGAALFTLTDIPERDYYYRYFDEWDGTPTAYVLGATQDASWLIDERGRPLTEAFADLTAPLWRDGHGLFRYAVYRDDEWNEWYGVVDEQGRDVLGTLYDSLEVLDLDRFWVHRNDRWGLIDEKGRWLYEVSDYTNLLD